MSQLAAASGRDFIVVAADRRVETRGDDGVSVRFARKLFPLGRYAVIATGGAAVGINISLKLARFLGEGTSIPFAELESYAMDVFRREYADFLAQGSEWFTAHPEAIKLSYVLLAGIGPDGAPVLRFYASESHGEPHRPLPVGAVLAAPRRLGLETALGRCSVGGGGASELKEIMLQGLSRIEKADEAVGGPFDLVTISNEGLTTFTADLT